MTTAFYGTPTWNSTGISSPQPLSRLLPVTPIKHPQPPFQQEPLTQTLSLQKLGSCSPASQQCREHMHSLSLPCSFVMLILIILEITHQSVVSRAISRHTARLIFYILSHIILYLLQLLIYNDSDITSLRSASSLMWRIHEERNGGLFAQIMSPVPQMVLHVGGTQQMSDRSWEPFCHCCMRQSNCPLSKQLRTSPNNQTVWVLLATLDNILLLPSSLRRA